MSKKVYCTAPHSYCGHARLDCELVEVDDDFYTTEGFERRVLGIFAPNPTFDQARSAANVALIQLLAQYLTDNPTQRFGQALRNLDIIREHRTIDPAGVPDWVNEFNTEPAEMLRRAQAALTGRTP